MVFCWGTREKKDIETRERVERAESMLREAWVWFQALDSPENLWEGLASLMRQEQLSRAKNKKGKKRRIFIYNCRNSDIGLVDEYKQEFLEHPYKKKKSQSAREIYKVTGKDCN